MAKSLSVTVATSSNLQNLTWFKGRMSICFCTLSPAASISGWTLSFTMRDEYGGSVLIQKTIGSGITVTSSGTGTFTVAILSADTNLASNDLLGYYPYDISRTDSGNENVLVNGSVFLTPGTTIQ